MAIARAGKPKRHNPRHVILVERSTKLLVWKRPDCPHHHGAISTGLGLGSTLVRDAIRQVVMKPAAEGPVVIWDGQPRRSAAEHDSVYYELWPGRGEAAFVESGAWISRLELVRLRWFGGH